MLRNVPTLDGLPEFTNYRDSGCEVHSSCLTCPLSQCRYDEPGWLQREGRDQRDSQILQARLENQLPVPELANRFNVSTRTVHRILRRIESEHPVLIAS